jgi:hypothetical protein
LERRGLQHPSECTLCCQEPETTTISLFNALLHAGVVQHPSPIHITPLYTMVTTEMAQWWTMLSDTVPQKQ